MLFKLLSRCELTRNTILRYVFRNMVGYVFEKWATSKEKEKNRKSLSRGPVRKKKKKKQNNSKKIERERKIWTSLPGVEPLALPQERLAQITSPP